MLKKSDAKNNLKSTFEDDNMKRGKSNFIEAKVKAIKTHPIHSKTTCNFFFDLINYKSVKLFNQNINSDMNE